MVTAFARGNGDERASYQSDIDALAGTRLSAHHCLTLRVTVTQQFMGQVPGGYRIDLYYSAQPEERRSSEEQARERLGEARRKAANAEAEVKKAGAEAKQAEEEVDRSSGEVEGAGAEAARREAADARLYPTRAKLKDTKAKVEQTMTSLDNAKAGLEETRARLEHAAMEVDAAQGRLEGANTELAAAKVEFRALAAAKAALWSTKPSTFSEQLQDALDSGTILSGNDWVTINSQTVLDFDSRITLALSAGDEVQCPVAGRLRGRVRLLDVLKNDGSPYFPDPLTPAEEVFAVWQEGFDEGSVLPLVLSASFDVPTVGFGEEQTALYKEASKLGSSLFVGVGKAVFRKARYGAVKSIELRLYDLQTEAVASYQRARFGK